MCRNIKTLFNFDPPTTDDEIRAASIQFVRKIAGTAKPSKANQPAFDRAIAAISAASGALMESLVTNAPPKNREAEAAKVRVRAAQRFGRLETAFRRVIQNLKGGLLERNRKRTTNPACRIGWSTPVVAADDGSK